MAPTISGLGLLGALTLALVNLDFLTGAGMGVNLALTLPIPVAAAAGYLLAVRLRRSDPERYSRLGTVLDDAAARPTAEVPA